MARSGGVHTLICGGQLQVPTLGQELVGCRHTWGQGAGSTKNSRAAKETMTFSVFSCGCTVPHHHSQCATTLESGDKSQSRGMQMHNLRGKLKVSSEGQASDRKEGSSEGSCCPCALLQPHTLPSGVYTAAEANDRCQTGGMQVHSWEGYP